MINNVNNFSINNNSRFQHSLREVKREDQAIVERTRKRAADALNVQNRRARIEPSSSESELEEGEIRLEEASPVRAPSPVLIPLQRAQLREVQRAPAGRIRIPRRRIARVTRHADRVQEACEKLVQDIFDIAQPENLRTPPHLAHANKSAHVYKLVKIFPYFDEPLAHQHISSSLNRLSSISSQFNYQTRIKQVMVHLFKVAHRGLSLKLIDELETFPTKTNPTAIKTIYYKVFETFDIDVLKKLNEKYTDLAFEQYILSDEIHKRTAPIFSIANYFVETLETRKKTLASHILNCLNMRSEWDSGTYKQNLIFEKLFFILFSRSLLAEKEIAEVILELMKTYKSVSWSDDSLQKQRRCLVGCSMVAATGFRGPLLDILVERLLLNNESNMSAFLYTKVLIFLRRNGYNSDHPKYLRIERMLLANAQNNIKSEETKIRHNESINSSRTAEILEDRSALIFPFYAAQYNFDLKTAFQTFNNPSYADLLKEAPAYFDAWWNHLERACDGDKVLLDAKMIETFDEALDEIPIQSHHWMRIAFLKLALEKMDLEAYRFKKHLTELLQGNRSYQQLKTELETTYSFTQPELQALDISYEYVDIDF